MERLGMKRLIVFGTPALRSEEDRPSVSTVVPGIMARILPAEGHGHHVKNPDALDHVCPTVRELAARKDGNKCD